MKLTVRSEQWPVTGRFTTSRGSQTEVEVVVGTLEADGVTGRGEATPCGRYGESAAKSVGELEDIASELRRGKNINELLAGMAAGATRNALDAACWDFCCKQPQTTLSSQCAALLVVHGIGASRELALYYGQAIILLTLLAMGQHRQRR